MKSFGPTSISTFVQDRIVYRNLRAYDRSLPDLQAICKKIGREIVSPPRKIEPEYAQVVLELVRYCRQQDQPGGRIEWIIYIGDTQLLDGTAFSNLCRVSGWPGMAFIGSEDRFPAATRVIQSDVKSQIMLANRWSMLTEFNRQCTLNGLPIEEGTVVVMDMDKTMVGARGRNGHVIDLARMEAVQETVTSILGNSFDPTEFQKVYQPLNQPEFHPFTSDNQDYLAYICLILGSGMYPYSTFVDDVRSGRMSSFFQLIHEMDSRSSDMPKGLFPIHQDIFANVMAGDPTPFKPFRRNEYRLTLDRFGRLEDRAPVDQMLEEEILITEELRQMAQIWRERGALLFGLSDKPDEASLPSAELEKVGCKPLHRAVTHSVGEG